jgi:nucleoside phosphorylase
MLELFANNRPLASGALDLLVAGAVGFELRPFARRLGIGEPLPRLASAELRGRRIAIACAGIGRSGDERVAEALRELRPAALINVGIAGALDRVHPAGSTWIVGEWRHPDQPQARAAVADAGLSERLGTWLDAAGIAWGQATAVTVDAPLHDVAERDRLCRAGAHLVEMEGSAWAALAAGAGVPFAAVRVVSDHADRPLPGPRTAVGRRAWLLRDDGTARRGRLLLAAMLSGAWLRPRHHYRQIKAAGGDFAAAARGLDAVAEAMFGPPAAERPGQSAGSSR